MTRSYHNHTLQTNPRHHEDQTQKITVTVPKEDKANLIRVTGSVFFIMMIAKPDRAKSYAHQRETTGSGNDSFHLRPFSKWELLLKERICSQRERILSFMSSFLWYGKSLLSQ